MTARGEFRRLASVVDGTVSSQWSAVWRDEIAAALNEIDRLREDVRLLREAYSWLNEQRAAGS